MAVLPLYPVFLQSAHPFALHRSFFTSFDDKPIKASSSEVGLYCSLHLSQSLRTSL